MGRKYTKVHTRKQKSLKDTFKVCQPQGVYKYIPAENIENIFFQISMSKKSWSPWDIWKNSYSSKY